MAMVSDGHPSREVAGLLHDAEPWDEESVAETPSPDERPAP
jgi:hypothetical protein